ncbi:unnamed protein product [Lactuca saligna]|uniref:Protein RDM1 n=1 Tax=Lactuca saligna TaxID=75948 RepID=A0AA35ZP44_LACSI|nr:unnamed protein product [Lactuca saligna]
MKRSVPYALDISSDDDDDDDKPSPSNGIKNVSITKRPKIEPTLINPIPAKKVITEELLRKSAKMYQEYMKEIPIPAQHRSIIPFKSWTGLANSMKQMYQQPLHYLTNIRMKEWDEMRDGDPLRLDSMIHPCKAETNIWLIEEVHRLTSSHQFIAKLWIADPMYYTFIDSVLPQL